MIPNFNNNDTCFELFSYQVDVIKYWKQRGKITKEFDPYSKSYIYYLHFCGVSRLSTPIDEKRSLHINNPCLLFQFMLYNTKVFSIEICVRDKYKDLERPTKEIILDYDITFEKYERNFYEGGIELDIDNLIINGNGKTINGSDISRIFLITGKNITLKNIIFKNGHSHKNHDNPLNNNGGAIKINHKLNIIIENCKFLNNTSESGGGAIHNEEGSLTIIESTLTGNKAGRAGAIINLGGKLIITESTLIGNTANGMGGAITNNGKLIITESTLTGNTTGFNGGAIFDNEGKLTITDSTLTGNTARGVGGAILSKNSSYEFKNCTFKDNKPDDVNEKD